MVVVPCPLTFSSQMCLNSECRCDLVYLQRNRPMPLTSRFMIAVVVSCDMAWCTCFWTGHEIACFEKKLWWQVGARCEVDPGGKRGVVKFVGTADTLAAGFWVGVQYDEPVGKHDGLYVFLCFAPCPLWNHFGDILPPGHVKTICTRDLWSWCKLVSHRFWKWC